MNNGFNGTLENEHLDGNEYQSEVQVTDEIHFNKVDF